MLIFDPEDGADTFLHVCYELSLLRNSKIYRAVDSTTENDRRLSAKLEPTSADRGCHVVNVTDPYGGILEFLDRSRYFFFQVAPQLYSRG
jgi:hypothetical protein